MMSFHPILSEASHRKIINPHRHHSGFRQKRGRFL